MEAYSKKQIDYHNNEEASNSCEDIKIEYHEVQIKEEETVEQEIRNTEPDVVNKDKTENYQPKAGEKDGLQKLFSCTLCDLEFETTPSLVRHVKYFHHMMDKIHRCNICDFNSNYLYSNRKEDKKFKCDLCAHKFVKEQHLELHKQLIHNSVEVINFECDNCCQASLIHYDNQVVFSDDDDQMIDSNNIMEKESHDGIVEQERSTNYEDIKVEYYDLTIDNEETNEDQITEDDSQNKIVNREVRRTPERFRCEKCDLDLGYQKIFDRHMESIHSKQCNDDLLTSVLHPCNMCDFKTKDKQRLRNHKKNRHATFECDLCENCFSTSRYLADHKEGAHNMLPPTFAVCSSCDFETTSDSELRQHVNDLHGRSRKFTCQFCDFKSNKRQKLKSHIEKIHFDS